MTSPRSIADRVRSITAPFEEFLRMEAAGGIVLFLAAAAAMIAANQPAFAPSYFELIATKVPIDLGFTSLNKSLQLLVNDGLMVVFFYMVGLEIKREVVAGQLANLRDASFSFFAALGGMSVPALVFFAINAGLPSATGWGIPMATDIAFALGLVSLLGDRVPSELKIFLLALAIVDDLGAIAIIALFYTGDISMVYLAVGVAAIAVWALCQYREITHLAILLPLAIIAWFGFLKSGIHATIAGVLLAFFTKTRETGHPKYPLNLDDTIHLLHPWVAFAIMPIFAVFNAGVSFAGVSVESLLADPLAQGIVVGLVLGNPIGVFVCTRVATLFGLAQKPSAISWLNVVAVGFIAGVGFTMSLFINSLAFTDPVLQTTAKCAIVIGSALAMVAGMATLAATLPNQGEGGA